MLSAADLFRRTQASHLPSTLQLFGGDDFLCRQWKALVSAAGFEIVELEIKKTGPEAVHEELCVGGNLFCSKRLLWLKKTPAFSNWKPAALKAWQTMKSFADGTNLVIAVQTPSDKRLNWKALEIQESASFEVLAAQKPEWLRRMNEQRSSFLDAKRISFLQNFDEELSVLEGWVELWSLGGDIWAESTLGWGLKDVNQSASSSTLNPAFAWVDAVLAGKKSQALKLLSELLEEGQEPLRLLALLSKSVRILSQLEGGDSASKEPDFLVRNLSALLKGSAFKGTGRARKLLHECSELDRLFKSTVLNPRAALSALS